MTGITPGLLALCFCFEFLLHILTHHVLLSVDFLLPLLSVGFVGVTGIVQKHVLAEKLGLPLETCDKKLIILLSPT